MNRRSFLGLLLGAPALPLLRPRGTAFSFLGAVRRPAWRGGELVSRNGVTISLRYGQKLLLDGWHYPDFLLMDFIGPRRARVRRTWAISNHVIYPEASRGTLTVHEVVTGDLFRRWTNDAGDVYLREAARGEPGYDL